MEASSSAHRWARKLVALGLDARIIAAHLVAPYRLQGKGGKNDANDAAAIGEAASRRHQNHRPAKLAVYAPAARGLEDRSHRLRQLKWTPDLRQ